MKKVFGVLLTLVLCLGLTGCVGSGDDSSASGNDVSGKEKQLQPYLEASLSSQLNHLIKPHL